MTQVNSLTLRDAKPGDATNLVLGEKTIAKTPGLLASSPDELNEDLFKSKIELLDRIPNGKYIVAEIDGRIVGHAMLGPMGLNSVSHVVRLTIAVYDGHQGKGIGEVMMRHLISWAQQATDVEKIELNVRASNLRAVRLYQKLGFVIEARLQNRVKYPNGLIVDDFEMGLFVKQETAIKTFVGRSIGKVVSARKDVIDDNWDAVQSYVELDSSQFDEDALQGIDSFSHVEVVFYMNQVDVRKIETSARHPRNNPEWPKVGIFAQRGKNRPNQIGTTICRVLRVEGRMLLLEGLDAVDGTPVLDIKPWVKEFGPRGEFFQPQWMSELMTGYWKSGR